MMTIDEVARRSRLYAPVCLAVAPRTHTADHGARR